MQGTEKENVQNEIISEFQELKTLTYLTDERGRTPLHCAVINRQESIVSELLIRGSDTSSIDAYKRTPLHYAVINKRESIVSELLKRGSNPSAVDEDGHTPLHYAVMNKMKDTIVTLLNEGSNPSVADKNGQTPLHYAIYYGTKITVSKLIRKGFDPNIKDIDGQTPLHIAVTQENEDIVYELLDGGLDPMAVDIHGKTPLHYAASYGSTVFITALMKRGSDPNVKDNYGLTPMHTSTYRHNMLMKEQSEKFKVLKDLKGIGLTDVDNLDDLLDERFQKCFWNRVYLVGPYSVGKSCLAKILVGELIPKGRQSTDGIWIYMGRAGMNIDEMKWVFFPKGNAIIDVLTNMLVSMSNSEKKSSAMVDSVYGIHLGKNVTTSEHITKSVRDDIKTTFTTEVFDDDKNVAIENLTYSEPIVLKTNKKSSVYKTKIPIDEKSSKLIESATPLDQADLHDKEEFVGVKTQASVKAMSKENDAHGNTVIQSNDKEDMQQETLSSIKTKKKNISPAVHISDISLSTCDYETSTDLKYSGPTRLAKIQHKNPNVVLDNDKPECEWLTEITSDMSRDKIQELIIKAVQEGKYKQKIVPIDIWDFGGQKDYYMTHQLFITSRGIFVLMFNGCIDLHKHMPDLNFLPGHFGQPTVAVYLLHWVNSILTYCKRTDDGFPRIIFVATHKDEKWFEWTREARRNHLEDTLQQLFESHAGLKHLEFKPLIFVNATNQKDPEIGDLRQRLMQRATEHPRWGEPMPTKWIPLELQLAQKSAEGVNIISRYQLMTLNSKNESMVLSEKQIETFLKVQHSLGKLLYFDVENLRDFIIILPAYLVEVLRSIVTEKQFWPKGERFTKILKNLQEKGVIERDDIYFLWEQETFNHIIPYKEYMIQILVHLDILIAPKTSFEDLNNPIQDVSTFLVPCMITQGNNTMFLKRFWKSDNSILLAYTFIEEVIPPALSYRFLSSFVKSWNIKNYTERHTEKRMLFSDLAVVKVDNFHDVAVQVKANRLIVSLIHAETKEDIIPTLASSLQECLTAAIVRISEFYSMLSEELPSGDANSFIPFKIEFGVFCKSGLCFFNHNEISLPTGEPIWICKKHKLRHQTKNLNVWFAEKETHEEHQNVCLGSCTGLGILEKELCPLPHHISRLAAQLSTDECREISIMMGTRTQAWDDLVYEFQHQPTNDLKFMALWSSTMKGESFSFQRLQKVLENKGRSKHLLCEVFRDVTIDVSDMSEETLNKTPSVIALQDLSNHIGNSNMQLAIELEVDISYIQQIQHEHKHKLLDQTRKVFLKWRQNKSPKPTVRRLLKASSRVGKFGPTYKVLKSHL